MTSSPEYLARLRVAIAEADGWMKEQREEFGPRWRTCYGPKFEDKDAYGLLDCALPDYCNSRDAIVEAILRRFKTEDEQRMFGRHLSNILSFTGIHHTMWEAFTLATATALQLAIAYARAASLDVPEDGE